MEDQLRFLMKFEHNSVDAYLIICIYYTRVSICFNLKLKHFVYI